MTAVYDAIVAHARCADTKHSFAHRIHLWLVDLDAMPEIPWWLRPFVRFPGRDHFRASDRGDIRTKLDTWLGERGVDLEGGRVLMLACPRTLGYVFNPITVYWCYRRRGELACVVAEVHNTYRGRHAYLLYPDNAGQACVGKEFYVSPFQPMDGEYWMQLPTPDSLLALTVTLSVGEAGRRAAGTSLAATVRGVRLPMDARTLTRVLLGHPLVPQRVSALIRKHGVALWLRGARGPRGLEKTGTLDG